MLELKEEALARTVWENRFGRSYGLLVGQDYGMNQLLTVTAENYETARPK
jgi:hypothetical protein